ncbi:UNVERIFIED_CONTAM: hypothetical protein Scaly_3047700 [Sesamum calycinum]|uniref:Reverse transcriptase domain-containing protein n=1 Tax=Sesamum calycinum TaxID=2727403 RepID=A0AAW2K1B5_9LAMI
MFWWTTLQDMGCWPKWMLSIDITRSRWPRKTERKRRLSPYQIRGHVLLQGDAFGLKNAGATYQRVMTGLFHDMKDKEIEVYVDDMIAKAKSWAKEDRKLLGFIVSRREIEVDLLPKRAIEQCTLRKHLDRSETCAVVDAPPQLHEEGLIVHRYLLPWTATGTLACLRLADFYLTTINRTSRSQNGPTGQGTVSGRQFLWGVGLPKGNGGVQRFPRAGRRLALEWKGRRELDCKERKGWRI